MRHWRGSTLSVFRSTSRSWPTTSDVQLQVPQTSRKAIRYHAQAGDAALDQLDSDQAADYFRQALLLLERVGPSTESRSLRADLLCSLGEAQRRADWPEYRQTLLDAADLALELGDTDRLARAALANSRGFFSVTWGVDAERERVMEGSAGGPRR